MNKPYSFEYVNENEFRKLERSLKKYQFSAYKKLFFDFYPSLKEGKFIGEVVDVNEVQGTTKYELKLPTERLFAIEHGDIKLHYTVYEEEKIIILEKLTPYDILLDGHNNELVTYRGVMNSKKNTDEDFFKIDLLNMIEK